MKTRKVLEWVLFLISIPVAVVTALFLQAKGVPGPITFLLAVGMLATILHTSEHLSQLQEI